MTHVITWHRRLHGEQITHLEKLVAQHCEDAEVIVNTNRRVSNLAGWVNCPSHLEHRFPAIRNAIASYLQYLDLQDAHAKVSHAEKINDGRFNLQSSVTAEGVEIVLTPLASTQWSKRVEPRDTASRIASKIGGKAINVDQWIAKVIA